MAKGRQVSCSLETDYPETMALLTEFVKQEAARIAAYVAKMKEIKQYGVTSCL